jgi:hypothetical protein
MLHGLLLDRSGAVRSMALWRWKRRWGDPGPVYRAVLASGSWPRQVAAAVRGLDEDRDTCLPAEAVPLVMHPSPAVRCAAADAVGHHGSPDDIVDHLAPRPR